MSAQLSARIYWLLNKTLVAEGLPDAWRVRLDGTQLDGLHTLDQIAQIQAAHPSATIEISASEFAITEATQAVWRHVRPPSRPSKIGRTVLRCVTWTAAISLCVYIFEVNHGQWLIKFLWPLCAGALTTLFLPTAVTQLLGSFAWFLHLLGDHTRAFLRGGVLGGAGGAFLGLSLWDFSFGMEASGAAAALTALAGGVLGGALLAHAHHKRCVRKLALEPTGNAGSPTAACVPTDGSTHEGFPSQKYRILLSALLLTLLTAQIPRPGAGINEDASWSSVLNYAHQKGWQYGTEIVYTYGPLGFLTSHHYSFQAPGLQMATKIFLAFIVALGVCEVAWRLSSFWKWTLIGIFYFFSSAIHAEGTPYAATTDASIYVGLLCWGVLCTMKDPRRRTGPCLAFAALAVLATLAKVSFIVPSVLGVVAVAGHLLMRHHTRLALSLAIAYVSGVVACWLSAGQQLILFGSFLREGFEIARGYHDAMSWEMSRAVIWTSVATGLLALSTLLIPLLRALAGLDGRGVRSRLLPSLWLGSLFFVVWKYGMVRSGQAQLEIFTAFMPLFGVTMLAATAAAGRWATWARALALATILMSLVLLETTFYRGFTLLSLCDQPTHLRWNMHWFTKPSDYWVAKSPTVPLPNICASVGAASVDVFGCEQAYALFNGLNYRPRPVFQSFAAYSAPLIQLNDEFFLSKEAPDYVLFDLSAIDGRFPPLEDSMVLRDLLINYKLLGSEDRFLLLKSQGITIPRMRLLQEGTALLGERIPLPADPHALLWMEVSMQPTLAGELLRLAYKSPRVELWAWPSADANGAARFLAPTPMLSAGFLVSPLLLNNQDVRDLYTGLPVYTAPRLLREGGLGFRAILARNVPVPRL